MPFLTHFPRLPPAWLPAPVARWAQRAVLALHVLAALALGFFAVQHPLGNWDLVPYSALVQREPGMSAQQLSELAHDDVRRYVGEHAFMAMIAGGAGEAGYQRAMFADPAALGENLRFYDVKPLYIALARFADSFTGNAAVAAVAVSAAAFSIALAVFPWFFRLRVAAAASAWLLVLTGLPPLWLSATAATPDTLALLFVLASALGAARGWPPLAIGAAALLAVLARPDAAFILCPLLLGLAWLRREDGAWKPLLACMVAAFALFVFLGSQALPWSTLFHHTFFERLAFPVSGAVPPMSLARYLGVVSVTLPQALELRVLVFLVAGLALFAVPWLRSRRLAAWQMLAGAAVAGMVLHFLVFPIDEFGHERMFLGSYFLIVGAWLLALERDAKRAPG